MKIKGQKIGLNYRPYIIAEMSNNHMGKIENAQRIIQSAAKAGADAIKIQTFSAESLTLDCKKPQFKIPNGSPWEGYYYYDLYKEIGMPLEWTESLFNVAENEGLTLFSSPFDENAVILLESLNCPAYKIASFEAQDDLLLKSVAATKKPIILSTGVSNIDDIQESIRILKESGSTDIALLHCISEYPANIRNMNLKYIDTLASLGCPVGLSDHSLGYEAAILAVAKGAVIIEKHLTINRADGGPDSAFSLEPYEFALLVKKANEAYDALGKDNHLLFQNNRKGSEHRRSLFAIKDIKAGEKITSENIKAIRPGLGLPPRMINKIIGKIATRDILFGDPIGYGDFE